MTDRIEDINKAVVYEIFTTMGDDETNALLTAEIVLREENFPPVQ